MENNNPLKTNLIQNTAFKDWPTLKISNINGNVSYLMPFRFYSFQVCGNERGEGDFGSSDPRRNMMLDIVRDNIKEPMVAKCLLEKEICRAINSYMNNNYGFIKGRHIVFTALGNPHYTEYVVNYIIPDMPVELIEFYSIEDLHQMKAFVDECYNFIVDYYHLRAAQ